MKPHSLVWLLVVALLGAACGSNSSSGRFFQADFTRDTLAEDVAVYPFVTSLLASEYDSQWIGPVITRVPITEGGETVTVLRASAPGATPTQDLTFAFDPVEDVNWTDTAHLLLRFRLQGVPAREARLTLSDRFGNEIGWSLPTTGTEWHSVKLALNRPDTTTDTEPGVISLDPTAIDSLQFDIQVARAGRVDVDVARLDRNDRPGFVQGKIRGFIDTTDPSLSQEFLDAVLRNPQLTISEARSLALADGETITGWRGTQLQVVPGRLNNTRAIADTNTGREAETRFDAPGTWDWSGQNDLSIWLRSDLPSEGFEMLRLYAIDSLGGWRAWNISLQEDRWTQVRLPLADSDDQSLQRFDPSKADVLYLYRRHRPSARNSTISVDEISVGDDQGVWWERPGGYWLFDGVDDWLDFPAYRRSTPVRSALTIEAFVRIDRQLPGKQPFIVGRFGDERVDQSYALILRPGGEAVRTLLNSAYEFGNFANETTNVVRQGSWHHVVVTRQIDGVSRIYLDGRLAALPRVQWGNLRNTGDAPFTIGAKNTILGTFDHFRGALEYVQVYNRALTADEVRSQFELAIRGEAGAQR